MERGFNLSGACERIWLTPKKWLARLLEMVVPESGELSSANEILQGTYT